MPSLNRVELMGNLTRDPNLERTQSGKPHVTLGLAINRKWKDDAGALHEDVTYVDVEVWGRTAETVNQHLAKGAPVFIEGRLALDQWQDKETGKNRQRMKVIAERIQFLGSSNGKPKSQAGASAAPVQDEPGANG